MTEQTTVENWVEQAEAIEQGEAPADKVFKLTGDNSVTSPGDAPATEVGPSYEKQHAKVTRFEISIGKDDDERSLEEFINAIRAALAGGDVNAHNVTLQGSYYIIDGKVCLEQDYDPATKNRKPGTYPPVWAGGPDPKKSQLYAVPDATDDEEEEEREFVLPERTVPRRDPVTGMKPRKPRSDKGVKKGPRKADADTVKAAVEKMGQEFREGK